MQGCEFDASNPLYSKKKKKRELCLSMEERVVTLRTIWGRSFGNSAKTSWHWRKSGYFGPKNHSWSSFPLDKEKYNVQSMCYYFCGLCIISIVFILLLFLKVIGLSEYSSDLSVATNSEAFFVLSRNFTGHILDAIILNSLG